ncbi:hypothetical protein CHISP_3383 [Chitinispirillum alkaliphilum]|nr:hypothetical protein CHISP_3383 [Chitinispirillum alkaliphilum]
MRISTVSQPLNAEMRKIDSARKNEKSSGANKTSGTDRSEFSAKGKRLNETKAQIENISASLSAVPEVREDKVAEVKSKIDSGFYNSEEFIDKLADKMLNDFGVTKSD